MAIYKPFLNPNKIKKTFEKTQSNLSEINNKGIKKLSVKFCSENHYKPVTIIPVVSDFLVEYSGQQVSVTLLDFPEWAINMASPLVTFHFDSAYQPQNEIDITDPPFIDGDLIISRWDTSYWFTKQDGLYKFNFKFRVGAVARSGNVFSSIPVFANISLYILNERNYNELQSGK